MVAVSVAGAVLSPGSNPKSTPHHRPLFRPKSYRRPTQGNVEMTRLLLSKGAHIDGVNKHGLTPLHIAADLGRLEVRRGRQWGQRGLEVWGQ